MKITINKPTEVEAVYLKVDAGVRYWEDARVNGIRDVDLHENKGIGKPLMPCAVQIKEEPDYNIYSDHYRLRPIIAIETGRIVNWMQGITANVHYKGVMILYVILLMKMTLLLLLMTAMCRKSCARQTMDMVTISL